MSTPKISPRANIGNGIEVRIYPLGDSITTGDQSSGGNGYRIGLQKALAGSKVSFVGSKFNGNMQDGWNEGWAGFNISQIAEKAKLSQLWMDPNIILIHAGTNDLNVVPPVDPRNALDRLGALIDQVVADGPSSVILVAQIIHIKDAKADAQIQAYNNAIPGIVQKRANAGHKVMVVDMRGVMSADLGKDGFHPIDAGYQKMADVWFRGIQAASNKGWIKAPKAPIPMPRVQPAPDAGSGNTPGNPSKNPNSGGSNPGHGSGGESGNLKTGLAGAEDSPNSGSLPDQYLGGGKEIPAAGLVALGLPLIGIPAMASLIPYAITAQNQLLSASQALKPLAAGSPKSGAVSAAADAVGIAAKSFGALSQQAKAWDLNTVSSSMKDEAQKEQKALEGGTKSLSDLVPRLRGCVGSLKRANECPVLFDSALKAVGGTNSVAPLTWFTMGTDMGSPSFFPNSGSGGSGSDSGGSTSGAGNGGGGSFGTGGAGPSAGGGNGGSVLEGGLPFPKSGLGSLGLPSNDAAAVNALKPYAITARIAVSRALGLLNSLTGEAGTAAADVSAAADALAMAASEYSEVGTAFGDIELTNVPGGNVFNLIPPTKSTLGSIAKQLGATVAPLRGCVSNPGVCQTVYRGTAGIVGAAGVAVPLAAIVNYRETPAPVVPIVPSKKVPNEWILNTIPGTSVKDFQAFIKGLPDRGAGRQIVTGGHITHRYIGKWTLDEARIIARDPIVDTMASNAKMSGARPDLVRNSTIASRMLLPRAGSPTIIKDPPSTRSQKILSLPKNKEIRSLSDTDPMYEYAYDSSAGDGTFVYVFDAGFQFDHVQFLGGNTEIHVVPGIVDENGTPVTTETDEINHGTGVAALVNGWTIGTAKSATVVGVKVSGPDNPDPEWVVKGWTWAIDDATKQRVDGNRLGKTVFCLPWNFPFEFWIGNNHHVEKYYHPPYNIPKPKDSDWWVPLLAEAWDVGIVTIISGGNLDVVKTMGETSPQRFGTADNAVINVLGVDKDGDRAGHNLPMAPSQSGRDATLQGHETVFAHAVDVRTADIDPVQTNKYKISTGNSVACPQVAGLAAYFLGLPNTVVPPQKEIPMAIKKHLMELARDGSHGGKGVAYNGVWEAPCGALSKRETKARNRFDAANEVYWKLMGFDSAVSKSISRLTA
ncbi:MAG: hypothetical protein Q9209_002530 [Squamulea sp. 1 TL-2023]